MKIIAVSNQKGGVGKTTTATTLAYGLQLRGKRVLLVDCDPQGNSTDTWRAKNTEGFPTLADLLFTTESAEECIQRTEVGDILAGDPVLEDAEKHLTGFSGFFKLKKRLEPLLPLYDHIILDTPPNLGILLQNALIAAEGVVVPILCDRYSLQGMGRFIDTVKDVKSQPNPDLEILGMLMVKYDERLVLDRELVAGLPSLTQKLGTTMFETKIRDTVKVKKAQGERVPLQKYAPDATAALDYNTLIDELERRRIV